MSRKSMLVGGREIDGTEELVVKSPFDGSSVATVARAQAADLEAALSAAERGFGEVRSTPSWRRAGWLFDALAAPGRPTGDLCTHDRARGR